MTRLAIVPEAEEELVAAAEWYEHRQSGLGGELVAGVDLALHVLVLAIAHARRRPGYWSAR